MKKLHVLFFAMLLSLLVLAGCNASNGNETKEEANQTEQTEGAFPVTVTDASGNDVTIEKEPEKIVSLIPSNTEIAFALGLGEKMVGVSDNDNYPEEVADIEKIGGMDFNVEKIISLKPDIVLAHESGAHNSEEGLDQLRNAGITVFVVKSATSFEQVYETMNTIGKITGTSDKANTVVKEMKAQVEEISAKAADIPEEDRKNVYIEIDSTPFAAGKNNFMDEMLGIIQANNVITEEGWPQVSAEAVIKANPDVIITTYGSYTPDVVDQVLKRDGWQSVTAIKEKRVHDVNPDLVNRPGPRLVEGVEELAKVIYPEVFKK
ncbi:ABC transporter substrate-binding protein [Bacillus sp. FJAT-47783]|uniref:ABC transporter substrate-binding protein n=1 Tax=Bacillus sp. FJAT-47783 TaxID=2922712 RepID=UPI001FAB77A5|nr:ABC transporter substrate-binding protein [Bacillus sp. FJAT-47783]